MVLSLWWPRLPALETVREMLSAADLKTQEIFEISEIFRKHEAKGCDVCTANPVD